MKNIFVWITIVITSCATDRAKKFELVFPSDIINFYAYSKNPVFSGTGTQTWDEQIRERGYILREDSTYHLGTRVSAIR